MSQVQGAALALFFCASCVTTVGVPPRTSQELVAAQRSAEAESNAVSSPPSAAAAEPLPTADAVATGEPAANGGDSAPADAIAESAPIASEPGAFDAVLAGRDSVVDARYVDVVSEQGQRAHGLYFTALTARKFGAAGIIRTVRSAGLDAAVIDIKDQDGRVSYDTHVESLAAERQVLVRNMPGLLRELKNAGIYAIGRIVCFSDPVLPRLHPELAVMDARPNRAGEIWNQRKTNTWLDPYNPKNHEMVVDLAVEAESLGFDEIQLDYIRFPVDEGTKFAVFPGQRDQLRRDVLLSLLSRVDEAVHVPLGVDVFGLTTIRRGDPAGLGQSLEDWAKHVEVFTPMLYVNGMKTWMRHKTEGRAGLLVEVAVRALRQRVGPAPVIRPFLQAFSNGADYYNGNFIAEQIRGARAGGGDGFLFWNPASTYGIVRDGMAAGGRGELPFAIEERRSARMQRWGQTANEPHATLDPAVRKPRS